MKRLIMVFVGAIFVVVGTPALALTLAYDGSGDEHLPVHLYTDEYDASEMLFTTLDEALTQVENDVTDDLQLSLSQDIINRAIYEEIVKENPDYAPGDNCLSDAECYIYAEAQEAEGYNFSYRAVGVWVSLYDGATADEPGRIVLNVFLEVQLNGDMTYKTVIETHFLFKDDTIRDEYYLEFDKVQIGRLPLPKSFFTPFIDIAEDAAGVSLEDDLDGIEFGEFNLDNLSYTLPKDEILTSVQESDDNPDSGTLLAQELLSIVFEQNLILFDVKDGAFNLEAGVSQFKSDDAEMPEYFLDLHDQEVVEGETVYGEYNETLFDPTLYLQDVFTQYLLNSALMPGEGFVIEEEIFNKLIYSSQGGFAETREVKEIEIDGQIKEIEMGLKALWFEFDKGTETDTLHAYALFQFSGVESQLKLEAAVEYVDVEVDGNTVTELHATFTSITFGEDDGENPGEYLDLVNNLDVFKQFFADMGDVEFGTFDENGTLIISPLSLSALLSEGTEEDAIKVTSVTLAQDALVLGVAANDSLQTVLDDFQDALNGVLGDTDLLDELTTNLNAEPGSVEEEILNTVTEIQASLTDPENELTQEEVDALLDNFDSLDQESQSDFLEGFVTVLDEDYGDDLSAFEQFFGEFNDTQELPEETQE